MDFPTDANVIVGLDHADDAAVYQITEEIAMIQTVDFFTPIVDDPYWFGQIAAANALSDVYAMGGVPKTAMNLVAFPLKDMGMDVLRQIIQGGLDKMREAEVVLVGGHSVEDKELKYGLSVTGFAHPSRVLTNRNLHEGDQIILTKPLGTGIINTAVKGGLASLKTIRDVTELMAALNRNAAEIMAEFPVHACTDVTGFGLLGHMAEMIVDSRFGMVLQADKIPVISESLEYAGMGLVPAGAYKNREFRECMVTFEPGVDRLMQDVLFDPQTSGGLLICVAEKSAQDLVTRLHGGGVEPAQIIGEVVSGASEKIVVK